MPRAKRSPDPLPPDTVFTPTRYWVVGYSLISHPGAQLLYRLRPVGDASGASDFTLAADRDVQTLLPYAPGALVDVPLSSDGTRLQLGKATLVPGHRHPDAAAWSLTSRAAKQHATARKQALKEEWRAVLQPLRAALNRAPAPQRELMLSRIILFLSSSR